MLEEKEIHIFMILKIFKMKNLLTRVLSVFLALGCSQNQRTSIPKSPGLVHAEYSEKYLFDNLAKVAYHDTAQILGNEKEIKHYPSLVAAALCARLNCPESALLININELPEPADKQSYKTCRDAVEGIYEDRTNLLRKTSNICVGELPKFRINEHGKREYCFEVINTNNKKIGLYAEVEEEKAGGEDENNK